MGHRAISDNPLSPWAIRPVSVGGLGHHGSMELGPWFAVPASREQNEQRMIKAAGVGNTTLICHRHTWQRLDSLWGEYPLYRRASDVWAKDVKDIGEGMVQVPLSGPNLVMLLKLTNKRRFSADKRALTRRAYAQVAKVIDAVDPDASPGRSIPPIVLDDKLGGSDRPEVRPGFAKDRGRCRCPGLPCNDRIVRCGTTALADRKRVRLWRGGGIGPGGGRSRR